MIKIVAEKGQEVIKAVKKAGYDLIDKGMIDEETAEEISRPLVTREEYMG